MTVRRAFIAAFLIGLLIGGVSFSAHFAWVRHETQQTLCAHNLKLVSGSLHRYARDHNGRLPKVWSELYPDYLGTDPNYIREVLQCPTLLRKTDLADQAPIKPEFFETVDYVLIPGRTLSDDSDTVLAYERGSNHWDTGHAELYVDGRAAWNTSNEPVSAEE